MPSKKKKIPKKKPEVLWTAADSKAAMSTGWEVFLTDHDDELLLPPAKRLEIQALDEDGRFSTDAEARHYVARCAARGWWTAKKALRVTGACILCGEKHSRDVGCESAPPVQPWCEGTGYHDSAGSCCRDLSADKE